MVRSARSRRLRGRKFAKPLGAALIVMTVVEPYSYTNLAEYRPESIEQYDERVTEEALDRLEEARKTCEALGVDAKTVMTKSFSPAEAVVEQAEKNDCDIIFMASMDAKVLPLCCSVPKRRRCSRIHRFP